MFRQEQMILALAALLLCAESAAAQPQTIEQQMIQAVEACDLARVSHSAMFGSNRM